MKRDGLTGHSTEQALFHRRSLPLPSLQDTFSLLAGVRGIPMAKRSLSSPLLAHKHSATSPNQSGVLGLHPLNWYPHSHLRSVAEADVWTMTRKPTMSVSSPTFSFCPHWEILCLFSETVRQKSLTPSFPG